MRRGAALLGLMFVYGLVIGTLFAGPIAGTGVAFTVLIVGGMALATVHFAGVGE